MTTRAERFTQLQKTPDLFSDFMTDLTPHPITKDAVRLRNESAIKQSIKNLVLTNYGERLFQPNIGSSVNRSLFEPNDFLLVDDITSSVRRTIEYNEPRVTLLKVDVISDRDTNNIRINILFAIINNTEVQNLDVIIRRVR
jgi:phage baseplate assembly protein W